jgi:glutathione synthase/RimK-type ligase-like ATP-grasp enzyme
VIVILAPPEDLHARRVAQEIELLGETAQIISWLRAARGLRASLSYAGALAEVLIQSEQDGPATRLTDVRAIWARRPSPPFIPAAVIDAEHRRFARQEWQDLLEGLTLSLGLDAVMVNPLPAQRSAVKPYQLAMAQRIGLRVPETLITSDPVRAQRFIDGHQGRVVHKAMTSPRNAFVDTRRWQEADRGALHQLLVAPAIFQQLVEGPTDIRATIVGQEIYAAAIRTEQSRAGLDSRLDLDVPTTAYEIPREIAARLQSLMAALGLTFATIDLKVDDAGQLHFLELNPQGQFLYIEILTGLPIAAAVARLLVRSARRGSERFEGVDPFAACPATSRTSSATNR